MAKNKITARFRLFSILSVLLSSVIARVFQMLYLWAASDIMVSDILAHIFKYSYNLTSYLSIALAISCTVYAHAYFGKKTAVSTGAFSTLGLASGKIVMYVYTILSDKLSASQMISGALTYFIEILFDFLLIVITIILCYIFARKRSSSVRSDPDNAFSPTKTAYAAAGAYVFILIADLSAMNVIPYFISSDNILSEDIINIVLDYVYYIAILPILIVFILLSMVVLKKVTGKLCLKQYFKKKDTERKGKTK